MAGHQVQNTLEQKIVDLLYDSIRAHNVREDDDVSLKTLKLMLVGRMLKCYNLDWMYVINLFKTHTPVHSEMVKELQGKEEVNLTLAQKFVRNEKLLRMMKTYAQNGNNLNQLLAVDGLGGPSGLNFDPKHYIGNLRYGKSEDLFDEDPECRRQHVLTVRQMYDMLKSAPVPEKHIYEILRRCFEEMARTKLPKIEFEQNEGIDEKLQSKVGRFYMSAMGKANIQSFLKCACMKKFRGEKRTATEREEESEPEKIRED